MYHANVVPVKDNENKRTRNVSVSANSPNCAKNWLMCSRVLIKKDGSRQSFDKRKVLNGMIRACEKRPVPFEVLEQKETLCCHWPGWTKISLL